MGFVRRHQRVSVVIFDVLRRGLFVLFLRIIRKIAVVDGPVRALGPRVGDGGRFVVLVILLGVCVVGHLGHNGRFIIRRLTVRVILHISRRRLTVRVVLRRIPRHRLSIRVVLRRIPACRLTVCVILHISRRRLTVCVVLRRIPACRLTVHVILHISRRRLTVCVVLRRISRRRLTVCVVLRPVAVHAVQKRVFRFLHGEIVAAAGRRGLVLVHGRAGKLVVPLDIQLRACGNLSAFARRGGLSRRAARDDGRIARPFVLLRAHDGERRLFLAPCGFGRFGRFFRFFRLKRLAHLFFLSALFFQLLRLFCGGLLLFLLLLQALLSALLTLEGQRVFALQLFFLPRVAQRVLLFAALPHIHAEVIQPFGKAHAHAAEREARQRHQHDRRRENQHNHAAPHVHRLIQRPRQQRAEEAAALAVQRAHRERAHEERAVSGLHAVGSERRVHAGDAEKLEHRFHEHENQRAKDQRFGAELFLVEEHEHRTRPADDHRQQQAENAAQPAHDKHATVEETAV